MKIDFSDIHDLTTCYARELELIHNAILGSNDKEELLLTENKIKIASLECQEQIMSKMLEYHKMRVEDFDANAFTD